MRLTKQSAYAVRIVADCAMAEGKLLRIADVAKRYNITKNNIAKTVPVLVRHGIIEGVRGRNGGIRLARPAGEITIGEIVRASETTNLEADCFGGEPVDCSIRPVAPINQMLDAALEAFISVLDQHTVADMIAGRKKFGMLDGVEDDSDEEGNGKRPAGRASPARSQPAGQG